MFKRYQAQTWTLPTCNRAPQSHTSLSTAYTRTVLMGLVRTSLAYSCCWRPGTKRPRVAQCCQKCRSSISWRTTKTSWTRACLTMMNLTIKRLLTSHCATGSTKPASTQASSRLTINFMVISRTYVTRNAPPSSTSSCAYSVSSTRQTSSHPFTTIN